MIKERIGTLNKNVPISKMYLHQDTPISAALLSE